MFATLELSEQKNKRTKNNDYYQHCRISWKEEQGCVQQREIKQHEFSSYQHYLFEFLLSNVYN